jgi:hypothetical protein
VFGEESMSGTQVMEWKIGKSPRLKKVRQVKSKVKNMPTIFFEIKGIVHKEFVVASHTVNSAICCDVSW